MGFSPSVTCGVWVGFDSRESLGEKETGARAALPIWMEIMKAAIAGKDDEQFLGDEEASPMLRAANQQPAKPLPPSGTAAPPAITAKPASQAAVPHPVASPLRIGSPATNLQQAAKPHTLQ